MTLAQGAVGGIVHHQKRSFTLYAEIGNAYNVGMHEVSDSARLIEKACHIFAGQVGM